MQVPASAHFCAAGAEQPGSLVQSHAQCRPVSLCAVQFGEDLGLGSWLTCGAEVGNPVNCHQIATLPDIYMQQRAVLSRWQARCWPRCWPKASQDCPPLHLAI